MKVIARFRESYKVFSSASGDWQKPSKILTSAGVSNTVTRVSGFWAEASLESTGLMQKDLIAFASSSVKVPEIT